MTSSAVWIALLRGINVGGKNKLPMKALAAIFEELGCTGVRTYIQSGNIVFGVPPARAKRIRDDVPAAIEASFGLRVPVVVRSAAELRSVARRNPYLQAGVDPRELLVAFLASEPSAARIAALDHDRSPPDEFEVRGSEVYLRCPHGVARSKLSTAWLDASLATIATVRNWNTVTRLVELADA